MKTVVFIPINSIQADLFIRIAKRLLTRDVNVKFFSLDKIYAKRYPNYLFEPVLRKEGFECFPIARIDDKYLRTVILKENPSLIVNSQDAQEPIIRKIMRIAKNNNIPGLVVQDAFIFWLEPPYRPTEQEPAKKIPEKIKSMITDSKSIFTIVNYGDNWTIRFQRIFGRIREIARGESSRWGDGTYEKIAVTGDYTKRTLAERNIPELKIIVTGQPRWDGLLQHYDTTYRSALFRKFGLDDHKKNILLTTQPLVESKMWSEEERDFFVISLCKIILENPEYSLTIKIHPREKKQNYEDLLTRHGMSESCNLFVTENIHELLLCCDVLLTHICTTALEAMILKKPVITIDFKVSTKKIPYVEAGASIGIDTPEQLAESLRRILYDPEYRSSFDEPRDRFVYDCAFSQDGKSTDRLVDCILDLMK